MCRGLTRLLLTLLRLVALLRRLSVRVGLTGALGEPGIRLIVRNLIPMSGLIPALLRLLRALLTRRLLRGTLNPAVIDADSAILI
ncbi:Uncharacterised protein [Mycobacteroides abscessus subsp. abscessus]|nr:hypothetical protein M879_23865 [Mycobacteroides abscessus V06705]SKV17666.1 Uncharacterised protein [Mycobacteroides abscessus subsp. abscessus]